MYKLFLCLRYLRSRIIAYFAILGVALCVAMMVIVISVMNGFLDKIEHAAKGLFGDIVIEPTNHQGIAQYDELIAAIRKEVPEVQAGSPFILSVGFLQVPFQRHIQTYVQVAGIRLPERAAVTDFAKGLFVQQGIADPTFDPDPNLILRRVAEETRKTREIYRRELAQAGGDGNLPPHVEVLLERLRTAEIFQQDGADNIGRSRESDRELRDLEEQQRKAQADGDGEKALQIQRQIGRFQALTWEEPNSRAILGLGVRGLSLRTEDGQTVRILGPGSKIVLNIFPLGRTLSATGISPNTHPFSIVDDCRTDVWSIDSGIVYVPFDTLQVLDNMDQPNRCSQIHLKVAARVASEALLQEVTDRVKDAWVRFRDSHPGSTDELEIQTWRQRQREVIGPIQSQRTLVTTMLGIISIVSVVLIFAIFYMIVFQKTREIGVMKAVGASGGGVAAIFLAYGSAVGLIGAALGTVLGRYFVHYINPIHDWVGRRLGFQVWDRKQFMFEKIPNTVDWPGVALIVACAVLAGLVGALIPAIRAGRMQPVEALRYE
jgi:lipoprotein-releasing system permease protein